MGVVSRLLCGFGWRTAGVCWGWGWLLGLGFLLLGEGLEEEFAEKWFDTGGGVGLGDFDKLG